NKRQFKGFHLPMTLTHTMMTAINRTPTSNVRTVTANSGVAGFNVASSPRATRTIKMAQRNAARPISGDSMLQFGRRAGSARDYMTRDLACLAAAQERGRGGVTQA